MNKLLLTLCCVLPLAANAENANRFYVSATGEYIVSGKADGDITEDEGTGSATLNYKNGSAGMAAFGYYVTNNVRAELEGGYRRLKEKDLSFTLPGLGTVSESSSETVTFISTMANAYYDLDTGTPFSPYLGAGLGWVHEQDGGTDAIGYQGMAGVNYKLSDQSTIFAGYRFFQTGNFTTEESDGLNTTTSKIKLEAHAIDIGYRFTF